MPVMSRLSMIKVQLLAASGFKFSRLYSNLGSFFEKQLVLCNAGSIICGYNDSVYVSIAGI